MWRDDCLWLGCQCGVLPLSSWLSSRFRCSGRERGRERERERGERGRPAGHTSDLSCSVGHRLVTQQACRAPLLTQRWTPAILLMKLYI